MSISADDNEVLGGCYCGKVRFQVAGDVRPLLSGYCHCVGCRQAHAAPIYEVAWILSSDFKIIEGSEHAIQKITIETDQMIASVDTLNRGGGRLVLREAVPSTEEAIKIAAELGIQLVD